MITRSSMNGNSTSRKDLLKLTRDQLRELARASGVHGFGSMRKPELVNSLSRSTPQAPPRDPHETPAARASQIRASASRLATDSLAAADRLDAEPLDPHWLRVKWVLTAKTMERAVMAMGADWHRAKSMLRLYRLTCDEAGPRSKTWEQDIPIPPQINQWFVNVPRAGGSWQLELGYSWGNKAFFTLMHGQPLTLPAIGTLAPTTGSATMELRPALSRHAEGVAPLCAQINVELLVRGTTEQGSRVTIEGENVAVSRDGTFRWQAPVVEGRVAIPIEIERDSSLRQRILMALERNTRFLEPEKLHPE
jgi:hypothetical protein